MVIIKAFTLNKIIIGALIVFIGVFIKKYYQDTFVTIVNDKSNLIVFSEDQLSLYNGIDKNKLYLAVLGHVFDVTKGSKHYEKGSPYNYFVGKDGTRALVSGNFKDESTLKDHVLDLSCNDLHTLVHWRQAYRKKYKFVGYLNGRYYDEHGKETVYLNEVKSKLKQCEADKKTEEETNLKYPPCNIAWNMDEGSRVWCTKFSGGIKRDWVGVPRQLYSPGEEKPRCVCINLDKDDSNTSLLKMYENCPSTSTSCTVKKS